MTLKWGKFISLEGGEGAGKSTQASLLAETLKKEGITVFLTREPGGSIGGEEIRRLLVSGEPNRWDPISESLLLCAARRDHWFRVIKPELSRGTWVICDRFFDSTFVYQGIGRGVRPSVLMQLHNITLGSIKPDLTLLFDVPVEVGLSRTRSRDVLVTNKETRFEEMELDFHHRLRRGFIERADKFRDRIVKIDASNDPQIIANTLRDIVYTRFSEEFEK